MDFDKHSDVEAYKLHLEVLFGYGVDLKSRTIQLNTAEDTGELEPHHFSFIDAALTELENLSKKAIKIKIFSYGGCVDTALAIVGRLKASKCKIITEGYGTIESAGTLILASGDERRISQYAHFMHHAGSVSLEGEVAQVTNRMKYYKLVDEQWAEWMAKFSTKPKKFYMTEGRTVDAYWLPEQILEYGIVDSIF